MACRGVSFSQDIAVRYRTILLQGLLCVFLTDGCLLRYTGHAAMLSRDGCIYLKRNDMPPERGLCREGSKPFLC